MADAPKRLWVAQDSEFRDYCKFFLTERAQEVLLDAAPDADDLALAKFVYADKVDLRHLALLVVNNSTLGDQIDANVTAGETLTIGTGVATAIRNAVRGAFHNLALSYKAAGLTQVV